MNKLLKVTLITAFMATSGMAGGGTEHLRQPIHQGFMPWQPVLFMVMPRQQMAPVNQCFTLNRVAIGSIIGFMACKMLRHMHLCHFCANKD